MAPSSSTSRMTGELVRIAEGGVTFLPHPLRGIAMQARDAVNRTKQLQQLREQYRVKLTEARVTAATLRLVDELFRLPVMTYAIAQRVLGFSWQLSRDTVLKLAEVGVIVRYRGKGKQHLYLCADIVRIVDAVEAGKGR